VCASAGNFGQGMAYAARKRACRLTVFAATTANPLKVDRMRALGATVVLEGADFDDAKERAERFAAETGAMYVEDGLMAPIDEGAGTIALELCGAERPLDAVFIPLGNGALVNGMGTWMKRFSPATKVIAVCSTGAPAMELSWRAGHAISTPTMSTIADGIAVRVPVPEALAEMRNTVDEVMLVTDEAIVAAMKMLFVSTAIAVEPAGAAGLAALVERKDEFGGKVVATPLTGGNLTIEQMRTWLVD
jgi:threonine dehydratase